MKWQKLEQLNKDATKGYKVVGMTASSPENSCCKKNNWIDI
jgi:hypothetical protein